MVLKTQLTFCFYSNFTVEFLIQSISVVKNEFRIGKEEEKYQTANKFRALPILQKEYRATEILQKLVLDLLGIILMIGYGMQLCGSILCNSTLILERKSLVLTEKLVLIIGTLLFQGTLVILLQASKVILVSSIKNIRSWENGTWGKRKDRNYMKAFQKSCRPFYIGYENYFRFTRKCVFIFLWRVYRVTFRVNFVLSKFVEYKPPFSNIFVSCSV